MEILNVGPLELGLILILALIVLGPDRMVKTSRQVAGWISKIVKSPIWKELVSTSAEIRSIPQKIVKEADLEETVQEISQFTRKPLISDLDQPETSPAEKRSEEISKEDTNA
jgi:Sec-independent protein translocase protein TatA